MKMYPPVQAQHGFTLIELMIAVAVVGILSAIAYPSYTAYVQRAHRAEAKSALLQDATILERNYTMANRYDNVLADGSGAATSGLLMLLAPGNAPVYTITVAFGAAPAQSFTLTATPIAGTIMATDECGAFTLTNTGVQNVTGTATSAMCWGR
ncbi:MAG: type IV pilin protein [Sulfuriferula sp.]